MNRIVKWAIALLVIAALGFGVFRALAAKKAQQAAVAAQANQPVQAVIELAQTDVLLVKSRIGPGIADFRCLESRRFGHHQSPRGRRITGPDGA